MKALSLDVLSTTQQRASGLFSPGCSRERESLGPKCTNQRQHNIQTVLILPMRSCAGLIVLNFTQANRLQKYSNIPLQIQKIWFEIGLTANVAIRLDLMVKCPN